MLSWSREGQRGITTMNRFLKLLITCHDGNLAHIRSCYENDALAVVNQEIRQRRQKEKMFFEVSTDSAWSRSFEVVRIAGFDKD